MPLSLTGLAGRGAPPVGILEVDHPQVRPEDVYRKLRLLSGQRIVGGIPYRGDVLWIVPADQVQQPHGIADEPVAVVLHADGDAVFVEERYQRVVLALHLLDSGQVPLPGDGDHHAYHGHAGLGAGCDGRLVRGARDAAYLQAEVRQALRRGGQVACRLLRLHLEPGSHGKLDPIEAKALDEAAELGKRHLPWLREHREGCRVLTHHVTSLCPAC